MKTTTDPISPGLLDLFERLYRDEFVAMVRLAHLLTGSNVAADDIAQDAFLRIEDRLAELVNPGGYLRTTVVNLSRNWHRTRTRRAARERWTIERVTAEPEHDVHGELLALVDELPFRQRAVLVARYWLDLPESEIAEMVGCRPGTVKSLNSRALVTLRKGLS